MRIISAIYMSAYLTNSLHLLTKLSPYLAHQPTNPMHYHGQGTAQRCLGGRNAVQYKPGKEQKLLSTLNLEVQGSICCIAAHAECSGAAVSPPPALYIIGNRVAFPQNIVKPREPS